MTDETRVLNEAEKLYIGSTMNRAQALQLFREECLPGLIRQMQAFEEQGLYAMLLPLGIIEAEMLREEGFYVRLESPAFTLPESAVRRIFSDSSELQKFNETAVSRKGTYWVSWRIPKRTDKADEPTSAERARAERSEAESQESILGILKRNGDKS